MQIILLQDIRGIGKKGELKDIKDGYARNFLIPRKMAMAATEDNMKQWHREQSQQSEHRQKQKSELEKRAHAMAATVFSHELPVDKNGGVFGAVNKQTIKDFLMRHHIEVSSEQIKLEHPLKDQGTYDVAIDLGQGVEALLKVAVIHKQKPA